MQNWLLQNLSDVLNRELFPEANSILIKTPVDVIEEQHQQSCNLEKNRLADLKARREWCGAIAAVEQLLLSTLNIHEKQLSAAKQGLIFAAPAPILSNSSLISRFQIGLFTPDVFKGTALMPCQQSAPKNGAASPDIINSILELPLIPKDPIAREQFCLILTVNFGLVLVLGRDPAGVPKFHFSFEPNTIKEIWETLRSRLVLTNYPQLQYLDNLVEQFAPPAPNYRLVTEFSRQLLHHLPDTTAAPEKTRHVKAIPTVSEAGEAHFTPSFATSKNGSQLEMELLQALTHEIRTPLTTIRTLTKLLLKRQRDFKPNVVKRLQAIDRECTEQIERMELIFSAAEFESNTSTAKPVQLVPFSLEQVFTQSIPRWQAKAQRRNVELDFTLPQQLPKIVSDPAMLDKVLTGLMESCTRSLPTGGHIDVKVSTAGNQLKLQVLSQASIIDNPLKSLGQLLTFQPETGCLSLNLDVTKNLFQALGGKLTVRQRQEQGKEFTIFLPLGNPAGTERNSGMKVQNHA